MNYRNRPNWGLGLLAVLLLTFGLAGCGGDEPAAMVQPPAPPPAPPPFVPQAVEVALGTSGDTLTLMTTEAGGYTLNGEAFASGTEVVADKNGSAYTLTLDGSNWKVDYKAPEAMSLALGTTGGSLSIERLEDGSYQANGNALTSGTIITADNGNAYTVSISEDGTTFAAEYVVPAALSIALGSSGSVVDVIKNEDGTFSINGEIVTADTRFTAENGNVYGAVLSPEGVPIGVDHVAAMQEVQLGALGGKLSLTQGEDKSWSITGTDTAVMDGYVHTAESGNMYKLMMGDDGMWTSMFQQLEVVVALGTQGSVTLARAEDMSWWIGSEAVMNGAEVSSDNGNMYTLVYMDGAWSANFMPMSMTIEGTGLTAMSREGDDMYDVNGATLSASGTGDVTVDGAMYHVWMTDDGGLAGARFGGAIHGDSDDPKFAIIGDLKPKTTDEGVDILPKMSGDDEDTKANELRTMLMLGDNSFSIADLLDSGMASDMGDNFVAKARGEIEKARGDAASLLGLSTEPTGLSGLLNSAWAKARTQVDNIFGAGKVDLGNRPGEDDLLDELDDIIAALSSGTQFAAATKEDGGGVFESAKLSESDALKAFGAAESEATVAFGVTGVTRYGAITSKERTNATSDPDYNTGGTFGNGDTGEVGLIGAFSYSTSDDVQRVWDIMQSGSAYYEGGTRAVSGDGKLFAGDIAIEVRFNTKRVSGLVTNLQTTDGDAFMYQYGEVESIILSPASNLDNNAHWSEVDPATNTTDAPWTARVTFAPRAGSPLPTAVRGEFYGQLLGKDPAGTAAQGTWSIGTQSATGSATYLAGGFGAMRTDDGTPVRPGTDNGSVHETVVTSNDGLTTALSTFKLDDGDLVVTMNRAGRFLNTTTTTRPDPDDIKGDGTTTDNRTVLEALPTDQDAPGDPAVLLAADELWLLDGDADTAGLQGVTYALKQSLANMVANAGTDRNVNGPSKQREIAVKDIETARADLAVLQGLDSRVNASEVAAWKRVQAALLRIFEQVPPKLAEAYDEDDALGLIDQALDAFASQSNLEDALARDGRGIFNNVTKAGNTNTEPGAALIWGRQEVQLKTHGGGTDYTRWGAWRVRTDRYAGRDGWTNFNVGEGNGNEPGSFAYSQLLPTKWSSHEDPGFPGGGSATFVGGTTAIQGTAFFNGDLSVTAEWDSDWNGTYGDALGTLSMRMTNFTNVNGDPLKNAAALEFYAIVVSGVNIHRNVDNEAVFNSAGFTVSPDPDDTSQDVTISSSGTFTALTGVQGLSTATVAGANVMGKFVGQDVEGPLAVIGTYNFGASNFTGAALRGGFGAERP